MSKNIKRSFRDKMHLKIKKRRKMHSLFLNEEIIEGRIDIRILL